MAIYTHLYLKCLLNRLVNAITELEKAIGYSSIKVSLTYSRGLEVPELMEDDMSVID